MSSARGAARLLLRRSPWKPQSGPLLTIMEAPISRSGARAHQLRVSLSCRGLTTSASADPQRSVSQPLRTLADQLSMLPEVKEAAGHMSSRQYSKAVPLLERAVEILTTSMGPGNTLAEAAQLQLAIARIEAGQLQAAESDLKDLVKELSPDRNHPADVVGLRLLLGGTCLLQGKLEEAAAQGRDAVEFCEKSAESYTDLLARALSLVGLCELYAGKDMEEAYHLLQKAARLAGKPVWQCQTAARLGAHHLYTGQGGGAKTAIAVWEETIQGLHKSRGESFSTDEALAEAELWLDLSVAHLGPDTASQEQRDLEEAERCASEALKLQEKHLWDDDPRMGRTLAVIARHRHLIGQAVSSEGLYRAALDTLKSPYAQASPPYRYELRRALEWYGLLLKDWERREREAEQVKAEADAVPSLSLSPSVPVSAMMCIDGTVGWISM